MKTKMPNQSEKLTKKVGVAIVGESADGESKGGSSVTLMKFSVGEVEEWKRLTRTDTYCSAIRILARIGADVYRKRMGDLA